MKIDSNGTIQHAAIEERDKPPVLSEFRSSLAQQPVGLSTNGCQRCHWKGRFDYGKRHCGRAARHFICTDRRYIDVAQHDQVNCTITYSQNTELEKALTPCETDTRTVNRL